MKTGEIGTVIIKTLCLFVVLAALSVSAQTNPAPDCCRHPYRSFERGVVTLTPLFDWWRHGGLETSGEHLLGTAPLVFTNGVDPRRPLKAWKRITGVRTGELDGAWVVNAQIAISPLVQTNEWILLRNPPAEEEQQYYNLKALVPQYEAQIASDQQTYRSDEKAEKKATAKAEADAQAGSKMIRVNTYDEKQAAARKQKAADAARDDEQQAEEALHQARKQLAAIPSADGQYQLDIFALELGRDRRGQLVFDAGVMLPDSLP